MDKEKKDPTGSQTEKWKVSRRNFVKSAATVAAIAAAVPLEPLLGGKWSVAEAAVVSYDSPARTAASFNYRTNTAQAENINVGVQPDNGDASRFTDFSGSYSKALLHDALGV